MATTDVVRTGTPPARERAYEELEQIFAGVDAPFALVDLDAMWSNAREMLARAAGTPIRVASKSVRCRSLLAAILEHEGFRGLMTFTLPESLWLHEHGFDDRALYSRAGAGEDFDGTVGLRDDAISDTGHLHQRDDGSERWNTAGAGRR